jgi:hypothetical protein
MNKLAIKRGLDSSDFKLLTFLGENLQENPKKGNLVNLEFLALNLTRDEIEKVLTNAISVISTPELSFLFNIPTDNAEKIILGKWNIEYMIDGKIVEAPKTEEAPKYEVEPKKDEKKIKIAQFEFLPKGIVKLPNGQRAAWTLDEYSEGSTNGFKSNLLLIMEIENVKNTFKIEFEDFNYLNLIDEDSPISMSLERDQLVNELFDCNLILGLQFLGNYLHVIKSSKN